ncbi:hypothetical protein J6590_036114 [Homalodisca vitripennis]|nr:hypothetical protein J6590_036114 [Homalodisca vitripennis]
MTESTRHPTLYDWSLRDITLYDWSLRDIPLCMTGVYETSHFSTRHPTLYDWSLRDIPLCMTGVYETSHFVWLESTRHPTVYDWNLRNAIEIVAQRSGIAVNDFLLVRRKNSLSPSPSSLMTFPLKTASSRPPQLVRYLVSLKSPSSSQLCRLSSSVWLEVDNARGTPAGIWKITYSLLTV